MFEVFFLCLKTSASLSQHVWTPKRAIERGSGDAASPPTPHSSAVCTSSVRNSDVPPHSL